MPRFSRVFWPCLLSACATACAAQTDPTYPGEPIAVLHGTVAASNDPPPSGVDAALVFLNRWDEKASGALAGRIAVQGSFPAQFRMDIFEPPPPQPDNPTLTINDFGISLGIVAAIASNSGDVVQLNEIEGVSIDTGIVYFQANGNAADPKDHVTQTAALLSVPAVKGYHLFRQVSTQAQQDAKIVCDAAGLCDHIVLGKFDTYGQIQPLDDRFYKRCRELLPDAPTCVDDWDPATPEASTETDRCRALKQERDMRKSNPCPSATSFPANPQGFDLSVQVKLGTNVYDWLAPSPQE